MNELSHKHRLFIDEMALNKEAADYGFEVLTKREIFEATMFEAIRAAGLLAAKENPGPTAAKAEGYVHIPYWPALDYLEGIARYSVESGNAVLANAVAETILDISTAKDDPHGPQDNYHTWRKFTEIISKLPSEAITDNLILQVNSWISSAYDRGMVVAAVGDALLPRLLKENNPRCRNQVSMLFDYVTRVRWMPTEAADPASQEPQFVADPYWLKKLLQDNAAVAIQQLGIELIELFRDRLCEIYSRGTRATASWLSRPAIEEHEQNHNWDDTANLLVNALRDSLIASIDHALNANVLGKLMEMYVSDAPIVRRIAIHVFDKKFAQISDQLLGTLDDRLLHEDCLHESYWFLKNHFSELPDETKVLLYGLIAKLAGEQPDIDSDDGARVWMQLRWLSAIEGQGFEQADQRLAALLANPKIKSVPDHPDFYSYMTSWSGPGPSPYTIDELVLFLDQSSLVSKVNAFVPKRNWPYGPTRRALTDTLELAIKQNAAKFFRHADLLLEMNRPYQYAFLNAFKDLWNLGSQETTDLNWEKVWRKLLEIAGRLLSEGFWKEEVVDDETMTPNRDWIPPIIVDLIKDGTRNDAHAFAPELLPAAGKVLTTILNHLPCKGEPPINDPMSYAINTPRGRAVDALFMFSLRTMRIADDEKRDRALVWKELEPIFEQELRNTNGNNFEFSTLAACYCAHLIYLGPKWFARHKVEILCPANDENFRCAMSGLAFAHTSKELYSHLRETGAIERAIASANLPEKSRDRIIERIVLAYLWSQEALDSPLLQSLFSENDEDDLDTAISFLWGLHNQGLSEEQVGLVLIFWRAASQWAIGRAQKPARILSRLAELICYVTHLDDADTDLILKLASFANENHSGYFFVEQLERLVKTYPSQVADFSLAYLGANGSEYDFEGRWMGIVTTLLEKNLRIKAIEIIDIMRKEPGFAELYRKIN